jgi:hypothetical protein
VEIMPDHYRSNLLCATSSSSSAAAAIAVHGDVQLGL